MRSRLPLVLVAVPAAVLLSAGCHARPESLLPSGLGSNADPSSDHLRGEPNAFVVLGDSSSFVWPTLLQELLDAHAGKGGLYPVVNGAVLADGIGAWTDAGDSGAAQALAGLAGLAERIAHSSSASHAPKTALCVVSLRGLGDASGPVKSTNDMVGAEMGANALERLALELRQLGVERVVFATPPYVDGAGPELGLEHVAIERLLARGHAFVAAGPDVFRATKRYFPDAYESDRVHLNEFGIKLVAEEWYRWLAGPEARERVVEALYAEDFDVEAIEAAHAREVVPING